MEQKGEQGGQGSGARLVDEEATVLPSFAIKVSGFEGLIAMLA